MTYSNELYIWLSNALFSVGILLFPVGIGFCVFPATMFRLASKVNRWISTDLFFSKINKPRYKESYFYRHHRFFGLFIIIFSLGSLYFLTIHVGIEFVLQIIDRLTKTAFEKWMFLAMYYVLLGSIILAVIFGIIMFVRPSALKKFEEWSNHWVDTDGPLDFLNKQKDLPDRLLPGNPRIFGFFVIIGAVYIVWNTNPF